MTGKQFQLYKLQVTSIHESGSIYAAKMTHLLSKLPVEVESELLITLQENGVSELILVSEGHYIKNNTFFISDDSAVLFFNGQMLAALKLRAGLEKIFPQLEISVNAFFVPEKIDVNAVLNYFQEHQNFIMDLYSEGSKNVFRIGYFTHHAKGRVSSKSENSSTETEMNIDPGFLSSIKAIFKPKVQINKWYLDWQLDAIYRKAKYGQTIMLPVPD